MPGRCDASLGKRICCEAKCLGRDHGIILAMDQEHGRLIAAGTGLAIVLEMLRPGNNPRIAQYRQRCGRSPKPHMQRHHRALAETHKGKTGGIEPEPRKLRINEPVENGPRPLAALPEFIRIAKRQVEPLETANGFEWQRLWCVGRNKRCSRQQPAPSLTQCNEILAIGTIAVDQNDEGIGAAVVSIPSMELFRQQPAGYRDEVLGSTPRIGVEAAVRQSWDHLLRDDDVFIGMSTFGASGPAPEVYEHFGITADHTVAAVMAKLEGKPGKPSKKSAH